MIQKQGTFSNATIENEKEVVYEDIVGHLHGDSEFTGPVSQRKCTNSVFLIIFLLFNAGLIGITVYILLQGNPSTLTKGNDIRGSVCGTGSLSAKRFMFFPNSTNTDWSLCIEECPYYYYKNYYCIYDRYNPNLYYPEWGCFDAYETTTYGFYCIPAQTGREIVSNYLANTMIIIKVASGDIFLAWDPMLIGYTFSLFVGLLYLFLMRIGKIAKIITIASVYALGILGGWLVYLLYEAGQRSLKQSCGSYGPVNPNYCDTSTYYFYLILSVLIGVFLLVYIVRILKKYPTFQIGINMIELTSKPLRVMKELAIFPIIQIVIGSGVLLLLALLIGWNLSTVTKKKIFSSYVPGGQAFVLEYTELEKYMLAYNAFMSIWWCNFLVDLGKFVMSGGVSTWYFSRQKSVLYVIFS